MIGDINLQGVEPPDRDELVRRLDIRPGSPFDPTELDRRMDERERAMRRQSYYEARISRLINERDEGRTVDVTLTVTRGPLVRVVLEGDRLPNDRVDDLVPIEREGSADLDLVEDSERRILAYLNGQGYWKAQVSADRVERGDELLIVFLVNRGPRYVVDTRRYQRQRGGADGEAPAVDSDRTPASPSWRRVSTPTRRRSWACYRQGGFASASVIPAVIEGRASRWRPASDISA